MIHIAVIALATGKYTRFVPKFIDSASKFLHPQSEHNVAFFFLTDSNELLAPDHVHHYSNCKIPHYPTFAETMLNRYSNILSIWSTIDKAEYDHVICMDVDMEFVAPVGDEVLAPLFACESPVGNDVESSRKPFYRNSKSTAYVTELESSGKTYCTGSLFGGSRSNVQKLLTECAANIAIDQQNAVQPSPMPEESHLNRWLLTQNPTILDMGYCHPQGGNYGVTPKIFTINKPYLDSLKERN